MTALLRDWLSIVLTNELKGAHEWQLNEARDRSVTSQAGSSRQKKYQDTGSAIRISCQSNEGAARYVQLVQVCEEHYVRCTPG